MKNKFAFILATSAMLAGCTGSDKSGQSPTADSALLDANRQELLEAINERDQLLALVNEINAATAEIKSLEQIVSINASQSEMSEDSQINSDLQAIKDALEQRRKKIDELEKKLKSTGSTNANLLATIENLKSQLASQEAQISELSTRLEDAQAQIEALGQTVAELSDSVQTVAGERDAAQQQAYEQEKLANACYYVVATQQELKNHKIIEGGFMKKTKVMEGDFDKSFFITRDKRTLTQIPLHSTKAKVLSSYQPEDSYEIVDLNGQKVLRILNPAKFWGVSNYLVVQVD